MWHLTVVHRGICLKSPRGPPPPTVNTTVLSFCLWNNMTSWLHLISPSLRQLFTHFCLNSLLFTLYSFLNHCGDTTSFDAAVQQARNFPFSPTFTLWSFLTVLVFNWVGTLISPFLSYWSKMWIGHQALALLAGKITPAYDFQFMNSIMEVYRKNAFI